MDSYNTVYPTPVSRSNNEELLREATTLEMRFYWNGGIPSGNSYDITRYNFITRELRNRRVL